MGRSLGQPSPPGVGGENRARTRRTARRVREAVAVGVSRNASVTPILRTAAERTASLTLNR